MAKAYFIRGGTYSRYDTVANTVDAGYPKALTAGWAGIDATAFAGGFDTGIDLGKGKLYLFRGSEYLRIDQQSNAVDSAARTIAGNWGGLGETGFADGLDAAINWGNGKAYFFKGDAYIQYDIESDTVDPGHPAPIAGNWPGMAEAGFGDSIDAAINWGDGNAYLFKGGQYVRYVVGTGVAADYPIPIADNWPGFSAAGLAEGVDASWIKLGAGAPPPPAGGLGPGDHVWYHDGRISTALDIPRTAWFRGVDPHNPIDYGGHGGEIFNYVVHAGGVIFGGQPHMKRHPGTFAWLDNNPGNITGVPGGPDWGQYRNKFNWHNFLIFPTAEAGFEAIKRALRNGGYPAKTRGARQWPAGKYRDLGVTEAFHRWAPLEDGNKPDEYGAEVAAAAGVPESFRVGDLDDSQMFKMQSKIKDIEGVVKGQELTRDHPDLPAAVRAALA